MIEVEKNFAVTEKDKAHLIEGAVLLYKKVFTDVYYDSPDYALTGKDFWLRTREGKFELKVPQNAGHISERTTDQYEELETDAEIARELGLSAAKPLAEAIKEKGFAAFATITTTRERYQKQDFHLDFDEMDFGFIAFEVELMVEKTSDIPQAEKRILEFGAAHRINPESAGKVIEYLRRYNPEHLAFLKSRGVA